MNSTGLGQGAVSGFVNETFGFHERDRILKQHSYSQARNSRVTVYDFNTGIQAYVPPDKILIHDEIF